MAPGPFGFVASHADRVRRLLCGPTIRGETMLRRAAHFSEGAALRRFVHDDRVGALSAALVLPALAVATLLGVLLGGAGLLAGGRKTSSGWFRSVVALFHRHRMVQ